MFSFGYILGINTDKSQGAAAEIPPVIRILTPKGFFLCRYFIMLYAVPILWP